jgi:hypothetical protein
VLEGNLRMSAQSRDLIRPNSAILVQQLSDCAGSTPWESRWLAHPDNSRQTGLLCVFALCVVQRVVCVRAHYNTSRGDRCARGPPLRKRATPAALCLGLAITWPPCGQRAWRVPHCCAWDLGPSSGRRCDSTAHLPVRHSIKLVTQQSRSVRNNAP